MPEAARVGDDHLCNHIEGTQPHRGGPIDVAASSTVMTGHRPQARVGDRCRCDGPPDFITTGAETVYVDGVPAARKGDRTMHMPMGHVAGGLGSVRIGGPAAGGTLGATVMGLVLCEEAATGRPRGSTKQSNGNCGVESVRQIINRFRRPPIGEESLLVDAISHGEASDNRDPKQRGGSSPSQRRRLLDRYGVEANTVPNRLTAIAQAVAEGRGVISSHVSGMLWGTTATGGHAVLVTGVLFDAEGHIEGVFINDTGRGNCGEYIEGDRFLRSLKPGAQAVVTRESIR